MNTVARSVTPHKTEQSESEPAESPAAPIPPPSPPKPSEEEQRRKAPGFARPTPVAAPIRAATPDTEEYGSVLSPDVSPAKVEGLQQQQPLYDSAPASPAPSRYGREGGRINY